MPNCWEIKQTSLNDFSFKLISNLQDEKKVEITDKENFINSVLLIKVHICYIIAVYHKLVKFTSNF